MKGKARKEAKATASNDKPSQSQAPLPTPTIKHTMTTKDLLRQAELVAKSTKTQLPANILRIVERAIHARRRCTSWFQKVKAKESASTDRHVHFTDILEKALDMLRRRPLASTDGSKEPSAVSNVSHEDLSNRFGALEIEDIDDDLDVEASDIVAVGKSQISKNTAVHDVYEIEDFIDFDIAFAIFCFFEDLHRMEDFLRNCWKDYKAGITDLITATMTTNAAIEIVRRAEEDIIAIAPQVLSKPNSYEDISIIIFYADSFSRGKDPVAEMASTESLRITPFDNFIYLPTARILLKFAQIAARKLQYPPPISPIRMSYYSRPELLELPEIKKWEEEDTFLSQLLMEMSFNDNIRKAQCQIRKSEPPVEDELSRSLRNLREKGEVSIWNVFASKVAWNIHEVMGKGINRSYRELKSAGTAAQTLLDFKMVGNALVPTGERWPEKDGRLCLELYDMLQVSIVNDLHQLMREQWNKSGRAPAAHSQFHSFDELDPETREWLYQQLRARGHKITEPPKEMKENIKRIGLDPIKPNSNASFIYTHNPLHCGTMTYNLAIRMEEVGIALANHHVSVFLIAHLYNALRQTEVVHGKWPEMEKLIEQQMGILFGGNFPKTPKEIHTRFAIHLGLSAKNFARNRRPTKATMQPWAAGKKAGPKFLQDKTSQVFHRYFDKEPLEQCLYRLEAVAHDNARVESMKKMMSRKFLTSLQFISQVREWFPGAVSNIQVDYITLTRTCNTLLRPIRTRISRDLDVQHPISKGDDSNDAGFVIMVLDILGEASDSQFFMEEVLRSKKQLPGGQQLQIAGEVLQEFFG